MMSLPPPRATHQSLIRSARMSPHLVSSISFFIAGVTRAGRAWGVRVRIYAIGYRPMRKHAAPRTNLLAPSPPNMHFHTPTPTPYQTH